MFNFDKYSVLDGYGIEAGIVTVRTGYTQT